MSNTGKQNEIERNKNQEKDNQKMLIEWSKGSKEIQNTEKQYTK